MQGGSARGRRRSTHCHWHWDSAPATLRLSDFRSAQQTRSEAATTPIVMRGSACLLGGVDAVFAPAWAAIAVSFLGAAAARGTAARAEHNRRRSTEAKSGHLLRRPGAHAVTVLKHAYALTCLDRRSFLARSLLAAPRVRIPPAAPFRRCCCSCSTPSFYFRRLRCCHYLHHGILQLPVHVPVSADEHHPAADRRGDAHGTLQQGCCY